jgi:hypothetical protein
MHSEFAVYQAFVAREENIGTSGVAPGTRRDHGRHAPFVDFERNAQGGVHASATAHQNKLVGIWASLGSAIEIEWRRFGDVSSTSMIASGIALGSRNMPIFCPGS